MKIFLLTLGLTFLILAEILRTYLLMPYPGSQRTDTLEIAYFLDRHIWWARIIGFLIIIVPLIHVIKKGTRLSKIILFLAVVIYGVVAYLFNFKYLADGIYHPLQHARLLPAGKDTTNRNNLVVGIVFNGVAKAYPVELIGYHHQVQDSAGTDPIMITYCTVCRSGRVYSPVINGKLEHFRLSGMDHYNTMFEDQTTKSWWRQENGMSIIGPLEGNEFKEFPSAQMSLGSWLELHPDSYVLQPDPRYVKEYAGLRDYDENTGRNKLERRDSASWQLKSWIVGVNIARQQKAYDWNLLTRKHMLQDNIIGVPLLITLSQDGKSFYVLNRFAQKELLSFNYDNVNHVMHDVETNSTWNINGICIDGAMKGTQLKQEQAYQEFWHSWKTFHPTTTRFEEKE